MTHPELDREGIAQRGEELYQKQIRAQIEIPENVDKIISIDLNSLYGSPQNQSC